MTLTVSGRERCLQGYAKYTHARPHFFSFVCSDAPCTSVLVPYSSLCIPLAFWNYFRARRAYGHIVVDIAVELKKSMNMLTLFLQLHSPGHTHTYPKHVCTVCQSSEELEKVNHLVTLILSVILGVTIIL